MGNEPKSHPIMEYVQELEEKVRGEREKNRQLTYDLLKLGVTNWLVPFVGGGVLGVVVTALILILGVKLK